MREDYSPKAKLECCDEKEGEELLGRKVNRDQVFIINHVIKQIRKTKNDSKIKLFNISIIMSCMQVKWKKSI